MGWFEDRDPSQHPIRQRVAALDALWTGNLPQAPEEAPADPQAQPTWQPLPGYEFNGQWIEEQPESSPLERATAVEPVTVTPDPARTRLEQPWVPSVVETADNPLYQTLKPAAEAMGWAQELPNRAIGAVVPNFVTQGMAAALSHPVARTMLGALFGRTEGVMGDAPGGWGPGEIKTGAMALWKMSDFQKARMYAAGQLAIGRESETVWTEIKGWLGERVPEHKLQSQFARAIEDVDEIRKVTGGLAMDVDRALAYTQRGWKNADWYDEMVPWVREHLPAGTGEAMRNTQAAGGEGLTWAQDMFTKAYAAFGSQAGPKDNYEKAMKLVGAIKRADRMGKTFAAKDDAFIRGFPWGMTAWVEEGGREHLEPGLSSLRNLFGGKGGVPIGIATGKNEYALTGQGLLQKLILKAQDAQALGDRKIESYFYNLANELRPGYLWEMQAALTGDRWHIRFLGLPTETFDELGNIKYQAGRSVAIGSKWLGDSPVANSAYQIGEDVAREVTRRLGLTERDVPRVQAAIWQAYKQEVELLERQSVLAQGYPIQQQHAVQTEWGRLIAKERKARMAEVRQKVAALEQEIAAVRAKFAIAEPSWRGSHRPPGLDNGAPLHDLTGGGRIYPDDVYSREGARLYGGGSDPRMDADTVRLAQSVRGQPNAVVTVYRAAPKGVKATIAPGDWVTINRQYAVEHGQRWDNGAQILSKKVKASEIFTNGDSIQEWGYQPAPPKRLEALQQRLERQRQALADLPTKEIEPIAAFAGGFTGAAEAVGRGGVLWSPTKGKIGSPGLPASFSPRVLYVPPLGPKGAPVLTDETFRAYARDNADLLKQGSSIGAWTTTGKEGLTVGSQPLPKGTVVLDVVPK